MATVVAVAVVTVGAVLAVGGDPGSPTRTTSGGSADTVPATSVDPIAPAGSQTTVTPSAQDAAEIVAAVRTSPFTSAVPPEAYEVAGTKLAASDPSWAWTEIRPKTADFERAVGVLHETGGRWVLVQIGTHEVGCGITPPQVSDDFDLSCPPPSTGPVVNA